MWRAADVNLGVDPRRLLRGHVSQRLTPAFTPIAFTRSMRVVALVA
jgi:hypothetical protein